MSRVFSASSEFSRVFSAVILGALGVQGCAVDAITVGADDDPPVDAIDDSFLSGGKADAFGIREGSAEALGILDLVNTATQDVLDYDAGLDGRAARGIVSQRNGRDGRLGTSDDNRFDSLTELDAVSYVGSSAFASLLRYASDNGYIDDMPTAPDGDSCGGGGEADYDLTENSAGARGVLSLVATASTTTLDIDAGLDSRAARAIVSYRGSNRIDSISELDSISYVGTSALQLLLNYAVAEGYVADSGSNAEACAFDEVCDSGECVPEWATELPSGNISASYAATRTSCTYEQCSPLSTSSGVVRNCRGGPLSALSLGLSLTGNRISSLTANTYWDGVTSSATVSDGRFRTSRPAGGNETRKIEGSLDGTSASVTAEYVRTMYDTTLGWYPATTRRCTYTLYIN